MTDRPTYAPGLLPSIQEDLDVLKGMYLEYFKFYFPLLEYRVADVDASVSNDFYGDIEPEDRTFVEPSSYLYLHYDLEMMEQLQERFGIDRQAKHLFKACNPQLEVEGVEPKAGDRIVFDGNFYEVRTAKRDSESYFGHTNYAFIMVLYATVSNPAIAPDP